MSQYGPVGYACAVTAHGTNVFSDEAAGGTITISVPFSTAVSNPVIRVYCVDNTTHGRI